MYSQSICLIHSFPMELDWYIFQIILNHLILWSSLSQLMEIPTFQIHRLKKPKGIFKNKIFILGQILTYKNIERTIQIVPIYPTSSFLYYQNLMFVYLL